MLELLLLSGAVFSLTHLLVEETGPYALLETLRYYVGQHSTVLECPWCTSLWVAGALTLLLRLPVEQWLLYTLAARTGGLLIWKVAHGSITRQRQG